MLSAPDPVYKNLRVLPKGIIAKKLDSIMRGFNRGLGVKCGFCHIKSISDDDLAFDKDDKAEKLTARNMMMMTDSINHQFFKAKNDIQTITCYTCHNGDPMVESAPTVNGKPKPVEFFTPAF